MGIIRGNAALKWIDSADVMTQRVLLLREPMRELRASHRQHVYPADSLDYTQRQIYTVGIGVYELVARVRFADNQTTLMGLIKAASKNTPITYVPSLSDPDTNYTCYLISPLTPTALKMDPNTGTIFGDGDVELVFRKTDGSHFQSVDENFFLFNYRAGDSLSQATFSRVTSTANPATYVASSGGVGGDGMLTTAPKSTVGTRGARLTWLTTASTQISAVNARNTPALLLETSRKNFVKDNTNLGTANWTLVGGLTRTSGQADPAGGTKAWLLTDASTTLKGSLRQTLSGLIAGAQGVSVDIAATSGTSGSGNTNVNIFGGATTTGTNRFAMTWAWSSGIPQFTSANVTIGSAFVAPERLSRGFYRFTGIATTGTTAGTNLLVITPNVNPAGKSKIVVYGPQVE